MIMGCSDCCHHFWQLQLPPLLGKQKAIKWWKMEETWKELRGKSEAEGPVELQRKVMAYLGFTGQHISREHSMLP